MNAIARVINKNTIHVYDKSQFDWYAIRNSGQIFRDPPCNITAEDDKVVITCDDAEYWFNYFDLQTDYSEIKKELEEFEVLKKPIAEGGGIRILRQPFEETVVSFIISANNNIKRFSKTIDQIDFRDLEKYSEDDFKRMGCGYRAPYLVKAVRQLKEIDGVELNKLDCNTLLKRLMTLAGVGRKVASCVALFSDILPNPERFKICPIDVHLNRALKSLKNETADDIINHKYSGIIQQYIFYFVQHLKKNLGG